MKKYLTKMTICSTLVAIGLALTGCNKESVEDLPDPMSTHTFTLQADNGATTKAVITEEALLPTRYVMEVYEATAATGEPYRHIEQATATFDIPLKDAADYTILFWADYGTPDNNTTGEYNATDLKAVKIKDGVAQREAWGGVVKFNTSTEGLEKNQAITLLHSVSQVNFKQDVNWSFIGATNKLKVTFAQTYSINLDGRAVAELKNVDASIPATFEKAITAIDTKDLATVYIFSKGDGLATEKMLMNVSVEFSTNNGTSYEPAKNIANVPFRANYKTNINGVFSDMYNTSVSFTFDEVWQTHPDFIDFSTTIKLTKNEK